MYNRDGTLKEEVFWPENTNLNPFDPANHKLIEETCLANPATRKLLGRCDLHRTEGLGLSMLASILIEMR